MDGDESYSGQVFVTFSNLVGITPFSRKSVSSCRTKTTHPFTDYSELDSLKLVLTFPLGQFVKSK